MLLPADKSRLPICLQTASRDRKLPGTSDHAHGPAGFILELLARQWEQKRSKSPAAPVNQPPTRHRPAGPTLAFIPSRLLFALARRRHRAPHKLPGSTQPAAQKHKSNTLATAFPRIDSKPRAHSARTRPGPDQRVRTPGLPRLFALCCSIGRLPCAVGRPAGQETES